MISASGVNDSCSTFNKIDLHVLDTFSSVLRRYFQCCSNGRQSGELEGKTYDLKSADRQAPIKSEHLNFSCFSVYIWRLVMPRSIDGRRCPFGAIHSHSLYRFLRLSRMLDYIAVQGLHLLAAITNFYDDFILTSPPSLKGFAQNSMELVFMLTGWEFVDQARRPRNSMWFVGH